MMAFNKYLSLLILFLAGIATAQPVTGPKLCENNSKQCAKRHGVCIKDCKEYQGNDQKCTRKCDTTDEECQCLICKQKAPCTEKGGRCVPFCKEDDAFMCDEKLCKRNDKDSCICKIPKPCEQTKKCFGKFDPSADSSFEVETFVCLKLLLFIPLSNNSRWRPMHERLRRDPWLSEMREGFVSVIRRLCLSD